MIVKPPLCLSLAAALTVGGCFAGNAIGKGGSSESYLVRIRTGDGSCNNIQVKNASGIRQGDPAQLDQNGNITRIRWNELRQ